MPKPRLIRALRRGIPVWLDLNTRTWFPIIAGGSPDDDADADLDDADDGSDDDSSDSDDDADDDGDQDDDADDDGKDKDDDKVDESKLPDAAKAILKKNRDEMRALKREIRGLKRKQPAAKKPAAAKKAAAAKKTTDDSDDDGPTEREQRATRRLQKASLLSALSKPAHGLTDATAAATLAIDAGLVDFDDEDEPEDVDDVVEQLVEKYPFLKGETPKKPEPKRRKTGGGGGGGDDKAPTLTADEARQAKDAGMTPARYAELKSVTNINDFLALQKKAKKT